LHDAAGPLRATEAAAATEAIGTPVPLAEAS
jgi:hypothetical protein